MIYGIQIKLRFQLNFMIKKKLSISHTSYNIIDKNSIKIGLEKQERLNIKI